MHPDSKVNLKSPITSHWFIKVRLSNPLTDTIHLASFLDVSNWFQQTWKICFPCLRKPRLGHEKKQDLMRCWNVSSSEGAVQWSSPMIETQTRTQLRFFHQTEQTSEAEVVSFGPTGLLSWYWFEPNTLKHELSPDWPLRLPVSPLPPPHTHTLQISCSFRLRLELAVKLISEHPARQTPLSMQRQATDWPQTVRLTSGWPHPPLLSC